jgi:predicted lipoprotein with Yx(FWY)xxD motif
MPSARVLSAAPILAVGILAACGSSKGTTTTVSQQRGSAAPAASGSTGSSAAAVVVTTKSSKLGTILGAGRKRLTVYLFEGDKAAAASCSGPCAALWPPVTTTAQPTAAGAALAAHLATITRSDGTTQVTYNGHPLYYYAKDGDAGDAYGQGVKSFGAGWYVVAPSGNKVDTS